MLTKAFKLLNLIFYQAVLIIRAVKYYLSFKNSNYDCELKNKKIAFFDTKVPDTSSTGERLFLELYSHIGHYSKVLFITHNTKEIQLMNESVSNVRSVAITKPIMSRKLLIDMDYFIVQSPESYLILSTLSFFLFVNLKVIYYSTDIFNIRFGKEFDSKKTLSSFFYSYYYKLNEPMIWKLSEFCLSNRADEALIIKKYNNNVSIVPVRFFSNFPKANFEDFKRKTSKKISFLFIGGAGNTPNISAMEFIFNELIKNLDNNLKKEYVIHIIGSGWDVFLNDANFYSDNVMVHGVVPDKELSKIYGQCLFSLAPLQYGTGVKGKVIEAMYYSLAVIATPVGVDGIDCKTLNSYSTAEQMLKECNKILSNEIYWSHTVKGYRDYLQENCSVRSLNRGLYI